MDILIIGLDGLSYNMLDRFDIDFPYLDQVRDEGVSGHLMSVDTPTTIPAWTSFATGKDPGSHGIYGMNQISPEYEHGSPDINTTDPAIYDLLDDSLFINLPASHNRIPAGENTYVQSSLMSTDKEEMTPEPLQELDSYEDYIPVDDKSLKLGLGDYRDRLAEIVRSRKRFTDEAFEKYDPRVGFVLFSTTDWAGHLLSKLSSEEDHQEFYRRLATEVAEATEQLSRHSENVVLMSDHGFEHKHTTIHLADWLSDQGYLVERSSGDQTSTGIVDRAMDGSARMAVKAAKTVSRRSDRVYGALRVLYNRLLGSEIGSRIEDAAQLNIDYQNSKVFHLRYGCLFINDERFENPQVTGDDVTELRDELVSQLETLTNGEGERIFREVLTADEVYADPGEHMPDIVPRPASGHHAITHRSPTGGYTSPTSSHEHRYRGIFAAKGPLFESGEVQNMSIVDVLPTVLAALGEGVSPDFDGDVRMDTLSRTSDPNRLSRDDLPTPSVENETERQREERNDAVEERLSDLGYMN